VILLWSAGRLRPSALGLCSRRLLEYFFERDKKPSKDFSLSGSGAFFPIYPIRWVYSPPDHFFFPSSGSSTCLTFFFLPPCIVSPWSSASRWGATIFFFGLNLWFSREISHFFHAGQDFLHTVYYPRESRFPVVNPRVFSHCTRRTVLFFPCRNRNLFFFFLLSLTWLTPLKLPSEVLSSAVEIQVVRPLHLFSSPLISFTQAEVLGRTISPLGKILAPFFPCLFYKVVIPSRRKLVFQRAVPLLFCSLFVIPSSESIASDCGRSLSPCAFSARLFKFLLS